jgi:hypothetical protein
MIPPACDTCKWWSEFLARVVDGGVIEAECLNEDSPMHGEFTAEHDQCLDYAEGEPIDG